MFDDDTAYRHSGSRVFWAVGFRGSTLPGERGNDIPQWDSLGQLPRARDAGNSLEQEFNIRFEIDELMALENVREIVRVVRGKLGGAS